MNEAAYEVPVGTLSVQNKRIQREMMGSTYSYAAPNMYDYATATAGLNERRVIKLC